MGKWISKTAGVKIFRVLEVIKSVPDKLYSGAIVNYPIMKKTQAIASDAESYKGSERNCTGLLNISKISTKPENELVSYDVAHHAGPEFRGRI
jgi:hypothetical protein